MKCPLCRRKLVIRYRVVESFARRQMLGARRKMIKRYHPIWWCRLHKFSVEINRRTSRQIVDKRPGTNRNLPPAGSASGL